MDLDRDACYRALLVRDARFDGRFFTAVLSTGIYCRPICPARPPKIENCLFLPSAAAAHAAGFRPCLRCRPEVSPELPAWRGTSSTVSRALALIADGALDGAGVEELAGRLGVGGRHLRRLFDRHVGVSPLAVARTRRVLFAKKMIDETSLSMTEVALAAGFASLRRFNDAMRRTYHRPPRALRCKPAAADAHADVAGGALKLPFAPPYNWDALVAFLAPRAIPGVEAVGPGHYRRSIEFDGVPGIVEVRPVAGCNHLAATIRISRVTALAAIVARLRRLFDLDANTGEIAAHLGRDEHLAAAVSSLPGLRIAGAWDGFELAVRAILGQQVSVAGATTLVGRLVAAHGAPLALDGACAMRSGLGFVFPRPEALADADLTTIGLPRARAAAISSLAAAVADDANFLTAFTGLDEAVERLRRLPGVGEWTAQYIAMRALREPDAFPASDLGLLRAVAVDGTRPTPARLLQIAESWRPWRAYAAMYLWMAGSTPQPAMERTA